MESFEQLIDKIEILGFTTYNSKIETLENTNWYLFPNGHNATFISMESLNMKYRLVKENNHVLFICPNSGAKSKNYTFEKAYEKIKKDFEDKLTFKAFNNHLFKELETPKETQELFDKNHESFNLTFEIKEIVRKCKNENYLLDDHTLINYNLRELHKLSFYEEFQESDGNLKPVGNNYFKLLNEVLGIHIPSNIIPKELEDINKNNMLKYLKMVDSYFSLIRVGVIKSSTN